MDVQTNNKVSFFFGVSKLDKENVDQWDPTDLG
jgi:hypothetical protein